MILRVLILPLLLVSTVATRVSISAENPRVTLSRDHTRLLVMFPPVWLDRTGQPLPEPPPIVSLPYGQTVNLRDTFKKCGVYDAATLAPIWQVDWFEQEQDLLLSDDFRYAARRNIHGAYRGWALAFYDGGKLVRSYNGAQLLTGLKRFIPFTSANWHYRWYENFDLSPDGKRVRLSTARRRVKLFDHRLDLGLQEFYTFDLGTGSMLEQRRSGAWVIWAYVVALLALIIIPPYALKILWRRIRSSLRRPGFPVSPPRA